MHIILYYNNEKHFIDHSQFKEILQRNHGITFIKKFYAKYEFRGSVA